MWGASRDTQDDRHHLWGRRASQCLPPTLPPVLMIGSVPGGGFAVTVNVASFLFCHLGTELLLNSVSPLEHSTTFISSELWLFGLFCELHCQAEISIWTGCGPNVFCLVPPRFCGWCRGFLLEVLHGDCMIYLQFASVVAWRHSVWDLWMSLCRPMACLCAVLVYYPVGVQSPLTVYSCLCITSLFISTQLLLSVAYKKDFEVLIGT